MLVRSPKHIHWKFTYIIDVQKVAHKRTSLSKEKFVTGRLRHNRARPCPRSRACVRQCMQYGVRVASVYRWGIASFYLIAMAKSLRSKSKLRAKSVKRKGEFAKHVDARNERLAAKLKEKTETQTEKSDKNETDKLKLEPKLEKISTSGWRDSRKLQYKQRQLKKKKNVTKF